MFILIYSFYDKYEYLKIPSEILKYASIYSPPGI